MATCPASSTPRDTAETGQVWTDDAKAYAFELTEGQPWLVNALAEQITEWEDR